MHICNTPETACGICAPLHNTVHPTSDLESMPPHHPNCRCTLVLLDEAYIKSLNNINKKSGDNLWTKLLDSFQTALDLVGLIPGLGEIADGTNAAIYLARGDYFNASLSATAMIPYLGWFSTGSKLGRKALKTADKIDDVARIVNKADDVSGAVKGVRKATRETLLEEASNKKLKNAIDQIYRPGATTGDESLADAIRHQISTGELVGGKDHLLKGAERVKNLENIIKKEMLNDSDLQLAQKLLNDLKNALGGK